MEAEERKGLSTKLLNRAGKMIGESNLDVLRRRKKKKVLNLYLIDLTQEILITYRVNFNFITVTGCPKKNGALKNIMLIYDTVQHIMNMSRYKVLYSNAYTMIAR